MRAGADWVGQLTEINSESFSEGSRQGLKLGRPVTILIPRRLKVKIKQPTPAIRPFEPRRLPPVEIGKLGRDLAGREAIVRQPGDFLGLGTVRNKSAQRQQGPPAVDATVPIEAAVEDRVQDTRRQRVFVGFQNM